MSVYVVVEWDKRYENSRSRSVDKLDWVPVPNSHDGEAFSMVMMHENGAQIFAAWILILQVASRCPKRGILVRENGKPHTAESLAVKTRGNVEWFRMALGYLSSEEVGWIAIQESIAQVSGECRATVTEEKGIEEKGREGNPPNPPGLIETVFRKPLTVEVQEYMIERGFPNPLEKATEFVDHYQSKGWKVGREPMKDWRACVRTWEIRMKAEGKWPKAPPTVVDPDDPNREPIEGVDFRTIKGVRYLMKSRDVFDEKQWREGWAA